MSSNGDQNTELHPCQKLAENGKRLHNRIWDILDKIETHGSQRSVLVGQRYFLTLEHLAGILSLFSNQIYVPAFALLRPLTESFIRGAWLQLSASDVQLNRFELNGALPTMATMIEGIEKSDTFSSGVLSKAHRAQWKTLCGLTHGGPEMETLCFQNGAIQRVAPVDDGKDAINYSASMGLLAALGISVVADCSESASALLELGKTSLPL